MSNSNSHTNLSSLSTEDNLKAEAELFHDRELTGIQNPDSDSSDEEELLQNVIKSAWQHNNASKVIAMFKTKKHRQIQYYKECFSTKMLNLIHSFWKNPWVIDPIMKTTRQIQSECNIWKACSLHSNKNKHKHKNETNYLTNLANSFIQIQS